MRKLRMVMLSGIAALCVMAQAQTPAFPGAEGFGRYTTGGRGGNVYHVTTLEDDGSQGSLRWALNQSGARTIVFDVSGTIFLKSALGISKANVTIAGQTAPGDGICIADYPFSIKTNNVIVRYIRVRLGNRNVTAEGADGWDGFGGFDNSNIMIDHCSISWSIDECCSVLGNKNSTVQWCLVSQSLQDAGHSKGSHGYGGNWGGAGASFHHNLMCHHESREPRLGPRPTTQMDERMDMRNNVLYNWGGNGCYGGENMNVNIVNNYYKPGPATAQRPETIQQRIAGIGIRTTQYVTDSPDYAPALHRWGKFYVAGNLNDEHPEVTSDNWTYGIYNQISNESNDNLYTETTKDTIKLSAPMKFIHTTTHTAEQAYTKVLKYAGCCISRDWIDTLMIHDTFYRTASYTGTSGKFTGDKANNPGIIDSQDDNKPANADSSWSPWPTLKSTAAKTDTDGDGMPDEYETAKGLNPKDAIDGKTQNSEGYTNLELYLNSIVENITNAEYEGGTVEGEETIGNNNTSTSVYELSQNTSNGDWTFSNNFKITTTKGYSAGANLGIKYSSGSQYTIVIPDGITITSMKIAGYDNYAETDSYLGELNGTTFTSTQYVFPQKDASGNITEKEYDIALAKPASGTITFTPKGKQVVWRIFLTQQSTGFTHVTNDDANCADVFTVDGALIGKHLSQAQVHLLPQGLYIINNKKVIIK